MKKETLIWWIIMSITLIILVGAIFSHNYIIKIYVAPTLFVISGIITIVISLKNEILPQK